MFLLFKVISKSPLNFFIHSFQASRSQQLTALKILNLTIAFLGKYDATGSSPFNSSAGNEEVTNMKFV